MMLEGKKILLGVTGSIAAYKAAFLVRRLVQSGAEVRVVMSKGALEFMHPLTFSTLSGHPVVTDFVADREEGTWNNHVALGLWPDLLLIAPASANTLAKMSAGQCDNVLLAAYMSARCQVMVAPAMDHDMFLHPGTQENLQRLKSFGHLVLGSPEGELASGLSGKGRMAEPEEILEAVIRHFHPALPLQGRIALVTAGPTHEPIDPVRFIGNSSSGKMGFALAEALAHAGARVVLVTGPVHLQAHHPHIECIRVQTAQEMHDRVTERLSACDIAVFAAAVADYRPAHPSGSKLKKSGGEMQLVLEPTPDIAAAAGKARRPGQVLVGFALETDEEERHAMEKLDRKNLDLIILNSLRDEGAGFGTDTNKVTLFWRGNIRRETGLKPKSRIAEDIVSEIIRLLPS